MTDRIQWGPTIGTGWKAVAEVAQAMDLGRPVQARVGPDHEWVAQESSPRLNAKFEYRIGEEAKPREFLIGIAAAQPLAVFLDGASCDKWLATFQIRPEVIRVREVSE